MPAARFLPGSVPRGPRHGLRPCDFCGGALRGIRSMGHGRALPDGLPRKGLGPAVASGHALWPDRRRAHPHRSQTDYDYSSTLGPQRHRVNPSGPPSPGRLRRAAFAEPPSRGRGRTSFAGAASRTTDEAHNDSPTRRAAASPGKLRRAASSGPRADALLLPSSEPRANGFSGLPRLPGHPIGLRPGIHSGWTDRRRTRNYAPPPGRRRGTRNYFPACRACSASRSSRTRRGMPTAERSRMWVSGLRIHAVSGLPGSTR